MQTFWMVCCYIQSPNGGIVSICLQVVYMEVEAPTHCLLVYPNAGANDSLKRGQSNARSHGLWVFSLYALSPCRNANISYLYGLKHGREYIIC